MRRKDWRFVRKIFLEGIATQNATFETASPPWIEWNKQHLKKIRLIAVSKKKILGWTALSAVSNRCIYAGVAEVSLYIASKYRGKGIGYLLLQSLIEESENSGIWTLQAGIFPKNKASIHLFKKCGFREVGYREKIGQLNDIWRDVILFERRSNKI